MALIDDVLPQYDVHEVHSIACARSIDEALATPVAADPLVRVLFRLRGLRASGTIGGLFERMGFEVLAHDEREIVVGVAGTPWRPGGGLISFAEARPGTVRIAVNFLVDGDQLSTETRVQAVDAAARRAFGRYWRLVGPFSALIRRRWLRRIAG
jgi:hypothetical protein